MLDYNHLKRNLSSSEDSSDSDSNNCRTKFGRYSKEDQFDGASCSKSVSDSDSTVSDESITKANQNLANTEKSGNKGMSLMVTT